MLKKFIAHSLIFSLVFNNLAFATQQILELDGQGSQTPQRLHTIFPRSNIADVSHIEIDPDKQQVVVHKLNKTEELQPENDIVHVSPVTTPIILQKWDVLNLPWNLEQEALTLFLIRHTAWLIPLEDSYKLEFKGALLGGMKKSGGGTYPYTITIRPDCNNPSLGWQNSSYCKALKAQELLPKQTSSSMGGHYSASSMNSNYSTPHINHHTSNHLLPSAYDEQQQWINEVHQKAKEERERFAALSPASKQKEQEKRDEWFRKCKRDEDQKELELKKKDPNYETREERKRRSHEEIQQRLYDQSKINESSVDLLKDEFLKDFNNWCQQKLENATNSSSLSKEQKEFLQWYEEVGKKELQIANTRQQKTEQDKEKSRLYVENILKGNPPKEKEAPLLNRETELDKYMRALREGTDEGSLKRAAVNKKEEEERNRVRQEKAKAREIEQEKSRLIYEEENAQLQKVLEEADRIFKQNKEYAQSDRFKEERAKREMELERKREEKRAQRKQKYEEENRQERERKEQKKKDKQKSQKDGQTVVDKPVWKPKPLDPKMRAEIEKIENRIKKLKQEEGRPFKSWLDEDDDLVSQKEETQEVEKIKPNSIRSQGKQINTVVPHNEQEKSNQTEKNKTWYKGLNEQTASKEGTSLFKNAPSQYQVTTDYFSSQAAKAGMTSSRALEILMEPTPENFYDRVILTSRQNWLGGTQDKTAFDLEGLTNGQAYKYISQGVLKEDFPALSNNLISQRGASLFQNATSDYFATQAEKAGMTSRKALDILMNPTPENFYDRVMLTSRQNWLGGAQDKTAFALEGMTNGQAYKYISQGCPKEDFSALSQDLISERLRTEAEREDGTGHFPKLTIANPQKNEEQILFEKDKQTEKSLSKTRGRQLERDLEIIQRHRSWSPGMGFDKIGYEIAKNPLKAKEDALETGDFMADLFVPFYGAGKGYMEGEYTGEMALMVAGIDLIPGKKIAGAVYKGTSKLGKVINEGIRANKVGRHPKVKIKNPDFSKETQQLVGKTDKKYKPELLEREGAPKGNTTLKAAEQELKGNQIDLAKQRGVTYDHEKKVRQAQKGLRDHIQDIHNRLSYPKLPDIERNVLQEELAQASKLLDHSEGFVPRITK